jgi:hypothetical protein
MATWTTLPDASLEPGKPIRSIDGLALRDNPVAITEGAAGAPRIVGFAAKRISDYPVLTVSAAETHSALNGIESVDGTTSMSSSTFVVARTLTIKVYTGSLRFRFNQNLSTPFNFQQISTAEVLKNGTIIATYSLQTSSEFVSAVRTLDISIAPNDVIAIRHKINEPVVGVSSIGPVSVFGTNGYIPRDLFIPVLEANTP